MVWVQQPPLQVRSQGRRHLFFVFVFVYFRIPTFGNEYYPKCQNKWKRNGSRDTCLEMVPAGCGDGWAVGGGGEPNAV